MTNFSYKLGFIGAGNMGKAIASGILSHGLLTENDILMSDINPEASFGNVKIVADAAAAKIGAASAESALTVFIVLRFLLKERFLK